MCLTHIVPPKHCEMWLSLHSVGITEEGCLKDTQWLHKIQVPVHQSIFNLAVYIDLPNVKLTCIKNVAHGQFGYIDLASYETEDAVKEVYVKRPMSIGSSLLKEACLQKLAGESLAEIGFLTGVPHVVHIFRLRDGSVCFAMEQIERACTLDKYIESVPVSQLSHVIIDCLIQLCGMKTHLATVLGMNHRDLKPSNCLIVEHGAVEARFITVNNEIIELMTKRTITLIDFGFACIGSNETHQSYVSLSTVYSKEDPCPKEGRDMYLFIALLYIDYHDVLPCKLVALFESWLDVPGSNLCSFMRKDKKNSKQWLYFIVGNEKIKAFKSCPVRIIHDLQQFMNSSPERKVQNSPNVSPILPHAMLTLPLPLQNTVHTSPRLLPPIIKADVSALVKKFTEL